MVVMMPSTQGHKIAALLSVPCLLDTVLKQDGRLVFVLMLNACSSAFSLDITTSAGTRRTIPVSCAYTYM